MSESGPPDYVTVTRNSYEEGAKHYSRRTASFSGFSNLQWQIQSFSRAIPPGIVLDLGAGSGRDGVLLSRYHEVVSGDICLTFLQSLRGTHRIQLDARSLPFRDNSLNGIWASAVYLHLTPADGLAALKEAKRVLRPLGIVQINVKGGVGAGFEESDGLGPRWFTYYQETEVATVLREIGLQVLRLQSEVRDSTTWITARARKNA